MKLDQRGQALVEFLLFLPFMLMMYSVILSVGNAINASINQQKVTRSYFYYRVQNNSTIPKPDWRDKTHESWTTFGMYIIGWKTHFQDNVPIAPCFRFRTPLNAGTDEQCSQSYNQTSTQFIRVGTVYGVCGATYSNGPDGPVRLPGGHQSMNALSFTGAGCLIK